MIFFDRVARLCGCKWCPFFLGHPVYHWLYAFISKRKWMYIFCKCIETHIIWKYYFIKKSNSFCNYETQLKSTWLSFVVLFKVNITYHVTHNLNYLVDFNQDKHDENLVTHRLCLEPVWYHSIIWEWQSHYLDVNLR